MNKDNIVQFDPDTGEVAHESMYDIQARELTVQITESDSIRRMTKSDGWRLVSDYISEAQASCMDTLKTAVEVNQIVRAQVKFKAYDEILRFIDDVKVRGGQAEEALKSMRE